MPAEARSIRVNPFNFLSLFKKSKEHLELIAALFSGLLLFFTWLNTEHLSHSAYITLHVFAFVTGGYAKAKEGIEATIRDRELNVEMLMILAAIGSASIGYWTEGAILIFIFALSGALETYTMNKSQREISSLMDLQPNHAWKVTKDGYTEVATDLLMVGDNILIKAGERVPSDGKIVKGTTFIDESAITGESLPVMKTNGEEVFAGTVTMDGSITVEITKPMKDTVFQQVMELVRTAQKEKSPSQLFIERFEGTYVKGVLLVVAFMLFLPHFLFGWTWMDTVYRAMILLVVASPCALVASIMPATLSAISSSARHGVLFKGGVHLENLSHIKAIAFDKTGTLTNGSPEVTDMYIDPLYNKEDVLAVIASIEQESNHPLAQAIVHYAVNRSNVTLQPVENMKNFSGQGVTAVVGEETWKIGNANFIGETAAEMFQDGAALRLASEGKTVVFAANEDRVIAIMALKDTVRAETKQAIKVLKDHGIYTVMLTGDNTKTAEAIAEESGIDQFVAECMPDKKVGELKKLKKRFKQIAMVGDGINDAPALAAANVGIAMGEGTDAALETADVVLMKNDLPRIAKAMKLSQRMNRVVKQNVVFSIAVIMLLIISNFFQVLDLPLGVIGHEGSTILVILNGLRLLKGYG
ncbi:heavy metal translocating P-type ATPase [Halobacillus naozhouensis]|uniref:Heavy metal translocating P-type ATPase n=1 Tax=Halobacillus naozhouensis TaxID=554880 RepID=A0ABY8J002_9BACI|nr:heavy metal translocating P-type ATPase [Halobacillus naozhouensis]WFT75810.1 heavy metal translocating P-type ATPase [Halobacillus naozhouensis]